MSLEFSASVIEKLLKKHNVTEKEVSECFQNRVRGLLADDREDHKTNPPTLWFVAETNHGRVLKVCFVSKGGAFHIKTAYEANQKEINIYDCHA